MTAVATASAYQANPWTVHLARISGIKREVPGISTYDLAFEDQQLAQRFRFQPGQFNMLYLPGFGESAISISSDPERHGTLGHTIRVAGNVTRALARKQIGDQIGVRGPYGSAWPMSVCRGHDVVLACGGVGLAPLRPAIYHVLNHRDDYGRVFLLYGALGTLDLALLRPGIPADVRRDLSQCRTHLWEVASTVAELTDAGALAMSAPSPDRMVHLTPEGHA